MNDWQNYAYNTKKLVTFQHSKQNEFNKAVIMTILETKWFCLLLYLLTIFLSYFLLISSSTSQSIHHHHRHRRIDWTIVIERTERLNKILISKKSVTNDEKQRCISTVDDNDVELWTFKGYSSKVVSRQTVLFEPQSGLGESQLPCFLPSKYLEFLSRAVFWRWLLNETWF